MTAYVRNEVEMEVSVKNEGDSPRWVECDIAIPEAISLAPDRLLAKGRMRIGICLPRERISKKIKIYGGASSYPDTFAIRMMNARERNLEIALAHHMKMLFERRFILSSLFCCNYDMRTNRSSITCAHQYTIYIELCDCSIECSDILCPPI